MKRMMILVMAMLFLFGAGSVVFAAENSPETKAPAMAAPAAPAPAAVKKMTHKAKTTHMRVTHMRTYGKVMVITEKNLKLERKVKGKAEAMEFTLEKPVKVKAGEMATVRYINKDGKNVALSVTKAKFHHTHHKKTKKL